METETPVEAIAELIELYKTDYEEAPRYLIIGREVYDDLLEIVKSYHPDIDGDIELYDGMIIIIDEVRLNEVAVG